MTYPNDPDPQDDDTRVVERERVIERPAPVAPSSNVNVAGGNRGSVATGPGPLSYTRRVVSLLVGVLAVLIALRIVLLLLVANQTNGLVDFIYNVTEPFVAPFRGVFNFDMVSPGGGSTLDIGAVVALIGWALIYLLIMAILNLGDRSTTSRV
ncbi:MAG: YggT family protein [Chloroflexota bacterium]|nr:YggT family protein [Chloroflexota bacterium]